jgi:hypothetical protein
MPTETAVAGCLCEVKWERASARVGKHCAAEERVTTLLRARVEAAWSETLTFGGRDPDQCLEEHSHLLYGVGQVEESLLKPWGARV